MFADSRAIDTSRIQYHKNLSLRPNIIQEAKVYYTVVITDKNKDDYTKQTQEEIRKKFRQAHKYITDILEEVQIPYDVNQFTGYRDESEKDYVNMYKNISKEIDEYMDITTMTFFAKRHIYFECSTELSLQFISNRITSFKVINRAARKSPFQTSRWTAPFRHVFERNDFYHERIYKYIR